MQERNRRTGVMGHRGIQETGRDLADRKGGKGGCCTPILLAPQRLRQEEKSAELHKKTISKNTKQ